MTNAEILERIEKLRRVSAVWGDSPRTWGGLADILESLVSRATDANNTEWSSSEARYSAEPTQRDTAHCKLTLETTRPISFAEQAVRMCELNRPVTIVFGESSKPKEPDRDDEAHRLVMGIVSDVVAEDGHVDIDGFGTVIAKLKDYYNRHSKEQGR